MATPCDDSAFPLLPIPIRSFVHFSIIDSTNDWGVRYLRLFHPPVGLGRYPVRRAGTL